VAGKRWLRLLFTKAAANAFPPRYRIILLRFMLSGQTEAINARGNGFMLFLKSANLALAFLLELCMLAALGDWGFHTGESTMGRIGLGLGTPLLAAIVWGTLLSPRATVKVSGMIKFILQVIAFGAAVVALFAADRSTWAWVFGLLVILNKILLYIWHQ